MCAMSLKIFSNARHANATSSSIMMHYFSWDAQLLEKMHNEGMRDY